MTQLTAEKILSYIELNSYNNIINRIILYRFIDYLKYVNVNKMIYIASENQKEIEKCIEMENETIEKIKKKFPSLYRDIVLDELLNGLN